MSLARILYTHDAFFDLTLISGRKISIFLELADIEILDKAVLKVENSSSLSSLF